MVVRRCMVPLCDNSSSTHKHKLFIKVPSEEDMRIIWLVQSGVDHMQIPPNLTLFICEDHFNLAEDIENYKEWSSNGERKILKPTAVPTIFDCQVIQNKRISRKKLVKLALKYANFGAEEQVLVEDVQSQEVQICEQDTDNNSVGVQVNMKPNTRTVATQCFFPIVPVCQNCPPRTAAVVSPVRPCTSNNNSEFERQKVKRIKPSSPSD